MKLTTLFVASAFAALATQASAFTFDFNSVPAGTAVPLTINVPGYGDVAFNPVLGSVLEIGENYETNGDPTRGLEFDPSDIVEVDFLGVDVFNVEFDFVDISNGEAQIVSGQPNTFETSLLVIPALNSDANGTSLVEVRFDAVPEPASAMLGLLGTCLLFLRRRR
jgi:hypothetical protein